MINDREELLYRTAWLYKSGEERERLMAKAEVTQEDTMPEDAQYPLYQAPWLYKTGSARAAAIAQELRDVVGEAMVYISIVHQCYAHAEPRRFVDPDGDVMEVPKSADKILAHLRERLDSIPVIWSVTD